MTINDVLERDKSAKRMAGTRIMILQQQNQVPMHGVFHGVLLRVRCPTVQTLLVSANVDGALDTRLTVLQRMLRKAGSADCDLRL